MGLGPDWVEAGILKTDEDLGIESKTHMGTYCYPYTCHLRLTDIMRRETLNNTPLHSCISTVVLCVKSIKMQRLMNKPIAV